MKKSSLKLSQGQSLIEFALLLPVLLVMIIALFDLGRAVFYYNMISNAAREGARYGIIHPNDTTGIATRVQSSLFGLDISAVTISRDLINLDADTIPDQILIRVSYQYEPATPFLKPLLGSGIPIASRSTMWIEH